MPLAWLALACGGTVTPVVDSGGPDCRGYDWDTVGAPFVLTWCTTCHSATAADRRLAPVGVDFDTVDGVQTWADRVEQRAVIDRTMPPAGGPFDDEVAAFATWLECGAR